MATPAQQADNNTATYSAVVAERTGNSVALVLQV